MSKKLSVETIRFLNHIERERKNVIENLTRKCAITDHDAREAKIAVDNLRDENALLKSKIDLMAVKIDIYKMADDSLLNRIKNLLLKLRIDIYSTKYATPRYFKTGKWWSRETGNFSQNDLDGMTKEEIFEAFEFYCDTDLPFLARPSMRDQVAQFETAKCLWYRYEALPESDRSAMSFPQFCGQARKEFKNGLKKEIEYTETVDKIN